MRAERRQIAGGQEWAMGRGYRMVDTEINLILGICLDVMAFTKTGEIA
jgi:hypothetical protein